MVGILLVLAVQHHLALIKGIEMLIIMFTCAVIFITLLKNFCSYCFVIFYFLYVIAYSLLYSVFHYFISFLLCFILQLFNQSCWWG